MKTVLRSTSRFQIDNYWLFLTRFKDVPISNSCLSSRHSRYIIITVICSYFQRTFVFLVIRSSATLIQNAYAKAKNTNALIRVPCNVAEFVADKSFKIAATVTNPLVKPLSGSGKSREVILNKSSVTFSLKNVHGYSSCHRPICSSKDS